MWCGAVRWVGWGGVIQSGAGRNRVGRGEGERGGTGHGEVELDGMVRGGEEWADERGSSEMRGPRGMFDTQ